MEKATFVSQLQQRWQTDPRWQGITRPYSAEDVWRIRGTVHERTNRPAAAHHDFAQSASVFDLLGERYQSALSHLALGRLVAAADEIQEIGARRTDDRFNGRGTWRCDRPGGQPRIAVGVIRRIEEQVVPPEIARVLAFTSQRVDDGRVALQSHAYPEPILVNRGDDWPLIRPRGFLLDKRRQRDQLGGHRSGPRRTACPRRPAEPQAPRRSPPGSQ